MEEQLLIRISKKSLLTTSCVIKERKLRLKFPPRMENRRNGRKLLIRISKKFFSDFKLCDKRRESLEEKFPPRMENQRNGRTASHQDK